MISGCIFYSMFGNCSFFTILLIEHILLSLLPLFFIPCYIAWYRHHHQRKTIFLLNLFIGLTGLGILGLVFYAALTFNLFLGWTGLGILGLVFYAALTKVEMTDSSQIEKKEGEGYVWIIPTIFISVMVLEIIIGIFFNPIEVLNNKVDQYAGYYSFFEFFFSWSIFKIIFFKPFIYVLVFAILFKIAFKKEGKKYIWLISFIVFSTFAVVKIFEYFFYPFFVYYYDRVTSFSITYSLIYIMLAILFWIAFWRAHKKAV